MSNYSEVDSGEAAEVVQTAQGRWQRSAPPAAKQRHGKTADYSNVDDDDYDDRAEEKARRARKAACDICYIITQLLCCCCIQWLGVSNDLRAMEREAELRELLEEEVRQRALARKKRAAAKSSVKKKHKSKGRRRRDAKQAAAARARESNGSDSESSGEEEELLDDDEDDDDDEAFDKRQERIVRTIYEENKLLEARYQQKLRQETERGRSVWGWLKGTIAFWSLMGVSIVVLLPTIYGAVTGAEQYMFIKYETPGLVLMSLVAILVVVLLLAGVIWLMVNICCCCICCKSCKVGAACCKGCARDITSAAHL
jgi:hypothetical protein